MKIQCSCGAKFAVDLTPEMATQPVKFVCPQCGLDSSDFVNQLIRNELAEQNLPTAPAAPTSTAPTEPPKPAPARLKISHSEKPTAPPPTESAPAEENFTSKYCPKHRGVLAAEKCVVCGKPICPECMEQFGFFCSPFCQNKADLQGIEAPVYAGQKFRVQKQFWRKAGLIFGSLAALVILFFGVWIWYAWFGSVPHAYFSMRFDDDDRAYAGGAQLVGQDQIVFLHGGTLGRSDLKTQKPVWLQELVTKNQIDDIVRIEDEARARANQQNSGDDVIQTPAAGAEEREAKIALQKSLSLHVVGQDIWVSTPRKLVHYDRDSGKILQEIPVPEFGGEVVARDGELLLADAQSVTHVNPADGTTRVENFPDPSATAIAQTPAGGAENNSAGGGLLSTDGKPLDPNKVAAQAQNLNLPARIALPVLLGNAAHEQQLEAALRDSDPRRAASFIAHNGGNFTLMPSENGCVQFSTKLLQENIVTREAMRAAPKNSALNDPNLNVSQTAEVANETLNEMQRNNGGDKVSEDDSRYQVTVHIPNSPDIADWTGEVVGPPELFSLKTVNVIAAGKTLIVLDKSNKKLWDATLTYNISTGSGFEPSQFGAGPCVEHNGTLYVFDQAVLSAFDLTTGNARWRLPSVGVVGLFFDDQNYLYVNTTTGNPDDIKYSRQIDITKSTAAVLMKIDPATGKTLWSVKPGGFISYLSGKFIYTVESYDPNPTDEEVLNDSLVGLQKPPYMRIARIDPKSGRVLWEHYQNRAPVAVQFDQNSIELIFKREVQVLKYLTF
jgi:outer membrane protein assembly factor BamB